MLVLRVPFREAKQGTAECIVEVDTQPQQKESGLGHDASITNDQWSHVSLDKFLAELAEVGGGLSIRSPNLARLCSWAHITFHNAGWQPG